MCERRRRRAPCTQRRCKTLGCDSLGSLAIAAIVPYNPCCLQNEAHLLRPNPHAAACLRKLFEEVLVANFPPLAVLAIGIALVIGLIVVARFHAFLALIISALVVSLMAPGSSAAEKVGRVAGAFGASAGGIAIVIAMAAIIGKCMMDSGAADRIVRAFLNALGERRAPLALMLSGFVLAVPVFFDTVFYLLVPLARSLFRRTQKNYGVYLLAIGAGGAITHTLVPPTPGPLLMAANLRIDLGVMILVGLIVALPAGLAGVIAASVLNRMRPIPMRAIAGQEEPEPLADDQLPSLAWALAPVLTPVLLISLNTALNTAADASGAALLQPASVSDWGGLAAALRDAPDGTPAAQWRESLADVSYTLPQAPLTVEQEAQLRDALNRSFVRQVYNAASGDFAKLLPRADRLRAQLQDAAPEERPLIERKLEFLSLGESDLSRKPALKVRENRLLLEVTFPEFVEPHVWDTPLRKAANAAAALGDPNLALMLAALISMFVFARQRKANKNVLLQVVEVALSSGGVIILITAAGGAFGAMLKEAQIGGAVEDYFASSEAAGQSLLLLGFIVAAVLKIAQGSSTVAMITASSIVASIIPDSGELPFHMVYLATAIGAGSLIVSWMNDSGFWIFTKMGGLTEGEALSTWTILLIVLGVVAQATTMILASTVPLV